MTLLETIPEGMLVALDTMVWIYEFEAHPRFGPLTGAFFRDALGSGRNPAGTSILALGELLVRPLAEGRLDLVDQYRRVLSNGFGLTVWEVSREAVQRAAAIRVRHGLKMIDALHVASAIVNGAGAFLTNDGAFRRVDELQVILLGDHAEPAPS